MFSDVDDTIGCSVLAADFCQLTLCKHLARHMRFSVHLSQNDFTEGDTYCHARGKQSANPVELVTQRVAAWLPVYSGGSEITLFFV